MGGLFLLFVAIIVAIGYVQENNSASDEVWWEENADPNPNACIVSINSQKVQYIKNHTKYKTTVSFSDGFVYVTHDTDRQDHFMSYTISADRAGIRKNALAAHNQALRERGFTVSTIENPNKFVIKGLTKKLQGYAPAEILIHCDSIMENRVLLETYLMQCMNNKKINKATYYFLLEQYREARERPLTASEERELAILLEQDKKAREQFLHELRERELENTRKRPNRPSIKGLATELKNYAPMNILEYCDSVAHSRVLLETYLMQCLNNKKIDKATYSFLLEQYTKAREQSLNTSD